MNREKLLETMREDFKRKDLKSLQRHFSMAQWFLTDDDKHKIDRAILQLEKESLPPIVLYALQSLGGQIVDKE